MGRFSFIMALILFVLTGCQTESSEKLDVSKLEKRSPLETEGLPLSYVAPSVEIALEAVPFQLTLPNKLPFESDGFRNMDIVDWFERDGKNISIDFIAIDQNASGEPSYVFVSAQDFQVELSVRGEEATLQNETAAIFNIGVQNKADISFIHNGVLIGVAFEGRDKEYTTDELKEIVLQLANQMGK